MALTEREVMTQLQSVFDDVFLDPVVLQPDLTAKEVKEWDSLVHITLITAVEEKFRIRFRMGEVEATRNVGEFANLILKRSNSRVKGWTRCLTVKVGQAVWPVHSREVSDRYYHPAPAVTRFNCSKAGLLPCLGPR